MRYENKPKSSIQAKCCEPERIVMLRPLLAAGGCPRDVGTPVHLMKLCFEFVLAVCSEVVDCR